MKKVLITSLVICFLFLSAKTYSQALGHNYTTAIGVKFFPGAVTLKHFTKSNTALEGLGYFFNEGFRFTGLYEIHGNINDVPGLKWYLGPGAHIGFWNDKWKSNYPERDGGIAIGVDGVIGLDYKINKAPINISLDWQPSFNFTGYSYFESGWGGLAIRYTLK